MKFYTFTKNHKIRQFYIFCKFTKNVLCCTKVTTEPNCIMLHKNQNTTTQYDVARKSKHNQTV